MHRALAPVVQRGNWRASAQSITSDGYLGKVGCPRGNGVVLMKDEAPAGFAFVPLHVQLFVVVLWTGVEHADSVSVHECHLIDAKQPLAAVWLQHLSIEHHQPGQKLDAWPTVPWHFKYGCPRHRAGC